MGRYAALVEDLDLAVVRTQAGATRYGVPIGTAIGSNGKPVQPAAGQQPQTPTLTPETQKTIKDFQTAHGLPATGQLDAATVKYAQVHKNQKADAAAAKTAAAAATTAANKAAAQAKRDAAAKVSAQKKADAAAKAVVTAQAKADRAATAAQKKQAAKDLAAAKTAAAAAKATKATYDRGVLATQRANSQTSSHGTISSGDLTKKGVA